MIPEQVGVTHVRLQHVHRFVSRDATHLEHRGASAGRAGKQAGAQLTGSEIQRTGSEIHRIEPKALSIGLDEIADRLVGEPRGAEPAALGAQFRPCRRRQSAVMWVRRNEI